jgi:GNAT superfamily N-acetyltransferase
MQIKTKHITDHTEIELEPKAKAGSLRYIFTKRKTRKDQAYIFAVRESFFEDDRYAFYRIQVKQAYEIRCYSRNKQVAIYRKVVSWNDNNSVFQLVVDKTNKVVRFGPIGNLGLMYPQHQGLGIGTYCMSRLIAWSQSRFNGYGVESGGLSSVDANTEALKLKRNTFYSNLGFKLEFDSENKSSGSFKVDSVNQLKSKWNRSKVREIKDTFLMNALCRFAKCRSDLQDCRKTLNFNIENYIKCSDSIGKIFIYGAVVGALATIWLIKQF